MSYFVNYTDIPTKATKIQSLLRGRQVRERIKNKLEREGATKIQKILTSKRSYFLLCTKICTNSLKNINSVQHVLK